MVIGQGSTDTTLSDTAVAGLLEQALGPLALDGRRVLVIIPDGTRTAPIPLLYRLLQAQLGARAARLDFLIALGTHKPMGDAAIDRLLGVGAAERAARHPNSAVLNHRWERPESFVTIVWNHPAGVVSSGTHFSRHAHAPMRSSARCSVSVERPKKSARNSAPGYVFAGSR